MDVLLKDSDMVALVLDFLHSRKLYNSAITLEKETGVFPTEYESLPEHCRYFRKLAIDGEWDNVHFYLEPLTESDEFGTSQFYYLILRQKYIESLHKMWKNETCNQEDKENVKKIVNEIQPYCSKEEFLQMKSIDSSYLEECHNLMETRMMCFKQILQVLDPCYSDVTGHGARFPADSNPKHTRLESAVFNSLAFNECQRYCVERATCRDSNKRAGLSPMLSTGEFSHPEYDFSINASLLFWIHSLKNDSLFCHQYDTQDVQIKKESLKISSQHHQNEPRPSPTKSTSFVSPNQSRKQTLVSFNNEEASFISRPNEPLVTQSVPSPARLGRATSNHLTSSVPTNHLAIGKHLNGNNNNNSELANNECQEVEFSSPKNVLSEHEGKQRDITVNNQNVKQELTHSEDIASATISPFSVARSEAAHQDISLVAHQDSSSFPNTLVTESHENFLEEKKRRKNENQQFLKELEQREKKSEEIRQLILQQHDVPSHASDVRKNLKTSIRSKFIPVEFTKDAQAIRAVAFHLSGQVYAVGSNSGTLRICSVSKEVTSTHSMSPNVKKSSNEMLTRSPKQSSVIAQRDHLHIGSIYCAAWNDDGSLIATGSNDKLIKIHGFDILGKTLDVEPQEPSFHRGPVREVTFLHESRNILASGGSDGIVYVYDTSHKKGIHSLAGHTAAVLGLSSWHQNMLASSSQDKTIRLWDARVASCVSIIEVGDREKCVPTSVCVDECGQLLAMGLDNSKIGIYDLKAGKMALEYKCHKNEVRCLRFNPVVQNHLLSSSYDGTVVLTDANEILLDESKYSRVAVCADKLIQCKWHPNGEAFATTSVDRTCKLWLKVK